jgi:hypothetical protein
LLKSAAAGFSLAAMPGIARAQLAMEPPAKPLALLPSGELLVLERKFSLLQFTLVE